MSSCPAANGPRRPDRARRHRGQTDSSERVRHDDDPAGAVALPDPHGHGAPGHCPDPTGREQQAEAERPEVETAQREDGQRGTRRRVAEEPGVRTEGVRHQGRVAVDPPKPLERLGRHAADRRGPPGRLDDPRAQHDQRRGEVAHGVDQDRPRRREQGDQAAGHGGSSRLGDRVALVEAGVRAGEQAARHQTRHERLRGRGAERANQPERAMKTTSSARVEPVGEREQRDRDEQQPADRGRWRRGPGDGGPGRRARPTTSPSTRYGSQRAALTTPTPVALSPRVTTTSTWTARVVTRLPNPETVSAVTEQPEVAVLAQPLHDGPRPRARAARASPVRPPERRARRCAPPRRRRTGYAARPARRRRRRGGAGRRG